MTSLLDRFRPARRGMAESACVRVIDVGALAASTRATHAHRNLIASAIT